MKGETRTKLANYVERLAQIFKIGRAKSWYKEPCHILTKRVAQLLRTPKKSPYILYMCVCVRAQHKIPAYLSCHVLKHSQQ